MRRKGSQSWWMVGIPVLVLAFAAGGCGDDDGGCTDGCDVVNSAQCGGTFIQICSPGTDGCLGWVNSVDCADSLQVCDDSTGNVICVSDCTDQCLAAGDTQCSGTVIETCLDLPNGCLDWQLTSDCADLGLLCEDYTGDASCMDECIDECAVLTDTQCNGTVIETCATGPDGCLDWEGGTDCADTSELCDDSTGDAGCVINCALSGPAEPVGPTPAHQATNVDESAVTSVDWADSSGAASYDVYFSDTCPPPAYPDAAFHNLTASELTGLTLITDTRYCWQVVAIDSDCAVQGPVWSFHTTCVDPVAGAPTVTSTLAALYAIGTTADIYTLIFSEDVTDVITGVTWTQVTGSGTLGTVTQVDPQTYTVPFSGVADGDQYTLTVTTAITDVCGNPLTAAVDIAITIDMPSAGTWANCVDYGTLQLATPSSPPTLPTGDILNDGSGSCWAEQGADIIASYMATTTDSLLFQWSNVSVTSGSYRNYEVWRNNCDPAVGVEEYCNNTTADTDSVTIDNVNVGDVFYIKAIAETSGADISSATFQVDLTACGGSVPGAPTVTSGDQLYNMGVTSGDYTLTFSEPVFDVPTSVTWTPVIGSGTMGPVVPVDPQTYTVPFSGAADGDLYTLTVSTGVTDDCGSPIAAPVSIDIEISSVLLPPWTGCSDAATLTLGTPSSPPQLPTGDVLNDGSGSCYTENGADIVAVYVATTSDPLEFTWTNVTVDSGSYRNYEIWRDDCESSVGSEAYCNNTTADSDSVVFMAVQPGDVFYMKAIAETTGADFTSATFEVNTTACLDPVPGAPTVTSGNQIYVMATVDGTYVLTFNEEMSVSSVTTGITWTPVTGSGTLGTVMRLGDFQTFAVPFVGAAAGDLYTLSVTTAVTDICGTAITTQVDIIIEISATISSFWTSCSDSATLTLGTPSSPPQLPTGDVLNDGSGSCYTENGADIIATYTATGTEPLIFTWTNVNLVSGTWRNYEIWRSSCDPGLGVEEFCDNSTASTMTTTIWNVGPGDVFYMKAIAETSGDDFTSATFQVDLGTPAAPGLVCSQAIDLDAVGLPYQATGTFGILAQLGGSCDTTADNAAWFTYTATADGWFSIDVANNGSSTGNRVAVFEGTSCTPLGTEAGCDTFTTASHSLDPVYLHNGVTYTIALYTSSTTNTMVDPQINITAGTAPALGDMCLAEATVGSANHSVDGNGHDCWSWTVNTANTENDHTFTCDSIVGGDVVVEFTTGPTATTLSFDASVANYETDGYIAIEITDAPCISGASRYCFSPGSTGTDTDAGNITVQPNTTYYIWLSDGYTGHYVPDINLCLW